MLFSIFLIKFNNFDLSKSIIGTHPSGVLYVWSTLENSNNVARPFKSDFKNVLFKRSTGSDKSSLINSEFII